LEKKVFELERQQATATLDEQEVLVDFQGLGGREALSYEETATKHRTSTGTIYRIVLAHGARRHEARIRERASERRRLRAEFLREVLNATHKADVLDFLDGLPDESVRLHISSVPYNVGKKYGNAPGADAQRHAYYLGWILQVLSEMERTLANGGVMFLQLGATKLDDGARVPLDVILHPYLRMMGLTFQNRVVWPQTHGAHTPKRRLAERYETALVFAKGTPSAFNATPARTPQKNPAKRSFRSETHGDLTGHPLGAWPTDVWNIPTVRHNSPEKTTHPAQFPEELARRAVLLYTMPSDLVCDAFVGSGTSVAAAKATSRAFTGCDLFYEDLRAERLARIAPDLASVLPGVTRESLAVWQAEARVVHYAPLEAFREGD
jgi:DNA modification methylase